MGPYPPPSRFNLDAASSAQPTFFVRPYKCSLCDRTASRKNDTVGTYLVAAEPVRGSLGYSGHRFFIDSAIFNVLWHNYWNALISVFGLLELRPEWTGLQQASVRFKKWPECRKRPTHALTPAEFPAFGTGSVTASTFTRCSTSRVIVPPPARAL